MSLSRSKNCDFALGSLSPHGFLQFDGAEERLDTDQTISETCVLCVVLLLLGAARLRCGDNKAVTGVLVLCWAEFGGGVLHEREVETMVA